MTSLAKVGHTMLQLILTAAALKAALATLSRPMQGAGTAPSIRNKRLGSVPVEDYDGLAYGDLDYERDFM